MPPKRKKTAKATTSPRKRKTATKPSAEPEPAAPESAGSTTDEVDDTSDEILNKAPPIFRLSNEILNPIFEMLVVHRNQDTGERLIIPMRSFLIIKRRCLRASRTCRRIYRLMRPMFYGLNTFDIEQFGVISSESGGKYDWHKNLAINNRTNFYRTSITLMSTAGLPQTLLQHTYLFPPPNVRCLLKNLNVRIEIPRDVVRGLLYPIQRTELTEKNPSWLFVIGQLAKVEALDLELLNITITVPTGSTIALPLGPDIAANRHVAKKVLKEFVDTHVPQIKAKKIVVRYPELWTEFGEQTWTREEKSDKGADDGERGLEDPET